MKRKRIEYAKIVGNFIVITPEPEEGFLPVEVDYSGMSEWELPRYVKEDWDEPSETESGSNQA